MINFYIILDIHFYVVGEVLNRLFLSLCFLTHEMCVR